MGLHQAQIIDWLGNRLKQVTFSPDLKRDERNPGLQILDGWGTLVDVLPIVAWNYDEYRHGLVPAGELVQHPCSAYPHGEIFVFGSGRFGKTKD